MFHSHYIPVKVISKWAAIIVSRSRLSLLFGPHDFTLFSLALIFLYIKGCPFINKKLSILFFLDCEGHH